MKDYVVSGSSDGSISLGLAGSEFTLRSKGTLDGPDLDTAVEIFKQALRRKKSKKKIEIEHTYLGDQKIPVLRCHPVGGKNLPTIIFIHGYAEHKALHTGRGIQLAEEGFHCILLDARMHGERRPDDFQRKFFPDRWISAFVNVLKGTAKDVSTIIDLLDNDRKTDISRVGLSGISMGGFTTFIAAVREKRIQAAAPMIGSPDLLTFKRNSPQPVVDEKQIAALKKASPLEHCEKLTRCALLVQNGAKDQTVSVQGTRKLDKALKKIRQEFSYRYIEYPDLGHEVPDEMMAETIAWFKAHL